MIHHIHFPAKNTSAPAPCILFLLFLLVLHAVITTPSTAAFAVGQQGRSRHHTNSNDCCSLLQSRMAPRPTGTTPDNEQQQQAQKEKDGEVVKDDVGLLARASWYAVEAFGNMFAGVQSKAADDTEKALLSERIDFAVPPSSLRETLQRIQLDNDRSYFLSGDVDKLIYDPNCIFADPFVSFRGRDRFVDNLQNLGSFITNYSAKLLEYSVDDAVPEVQTKLMVKLELNLPWKPVLAWPWGVKYSIDQQSFLVTEHIESWDIKPLDGVKQIFRKPTTRIT